MTWLNCTLEEYTVPFTIMRPNCSSDGDVCWKNCTTVPDTKMMPQMNCEVKVMIQDTFRHLLHIYNDP